MGARFQSRQLVSRIALLSGLAFVLGGCGAEEELKPDEGVSPFQTARRDDAEQKNEVRPVTKFNSQDPKSAKPTGDVIAEKRKSELPPSATTPEQFSFEDLDKLNNAGKKLGEKGEFAESAKAFDQVLGADPKNRVALYGRAAAGTELLGTLSEQDRLVEIGRDADLIRTLKKTYNPLQPFEAKAFGLILFNEATVLGSIGEHDKALESLQEAIESGFTAWGLAESAPPLKEARTKPLYAKLLAQMKETSKKLAYLNIKRRLSLPYEFPFNFRLTDTNGKTVALDDLKGKVVLVDFWGTWCGPCLGAIPGLVDLHQKYAKDGLVIVGIAREKVSPEAAKAVVKQFVEQNKIPYTVVLGNDETEAQVPNFQGYPTSLLIDAKGKIRFGSTGAQEGEAQNIEDAVIVLLDERNSGKSILPAAESAKKP